MRREGKVIDGLLEGVREKNVCCLKRAARHKEIDAFGGCSRNLNAPYR